MGEKKAKKLGFEVLLEFEKKRGIGGIRGIREGVDFERKENQDEESEGCDDIAVLGFWKKKKQNKSGFGLS